MKYLGRPRAWDRPSRRWNPHLMRIEYAVCTFENGLAIFPTAGLETMEEGSWWIKLEIVVKAHVM